jgi:hypothetical protein
MSCIGHCGNKGPAAQGEAFSGDEAIKMMAACADAKNRVYYERFAGKLR